ncbi:hypothetical protein H4R21_001419, partial [Coemansia helicoidea]
RPTSATRLTASTLLRAGSPRPGPSRAVLWSGPGRTWSARSRRRSRTTKAQNVSMLWRRPRLFSRACRSAHPPPSSPPTTRARAASPAVSATTPGSPRTTRPSSVPWADPTEGTWQVCWWPVAAA